MGDPGRMQLPNSVRAWVGLAALARDSARRLPGQAIELPMLAVSTALQASLRAQQRYARLIARGDEVLNRNRTTDEPPAWATFDDPVEPEAIEKAAEHAATRPSRGRPRTKNVAAPRHTRPSAFDVVGDGPTSDDTHATASDD